MLIIAYNPDLKITNLQQLSKGTGARYLEVLDDQKLHGVYIACRWKRNVPNKLDKGHVLIDMKPNS